MSPLIATFSKKFQEKQRKHNQSLPLSLDLLPNLSQKLSVLGMEMSKGSVTNLVDGSLPRELLPMKQHTGEGNIKQIQVEHTQVGE